MNYTDSLCFSSSSDVCCRHSGRFNLQPPRVLHNGFNICPWGTNVSVKVSTFIACIIFYPLHSFLCEKCPSQTSPEPFTLNCKSLRALFPPILALIKEECTWMWLNKLRILYVNGTDSPQNVSTGVLCCYGNVCNTQGIFTLDVVLCNTYVFLKCLWWFRSLPYQHALLYFPKCVSVEGTWVGGQSLGMTDSTLHFVCMLFI